jgi:hypothetical protein
MSARYWTVGKPLRTLVGQPRRGTVSTLITQCPAYVPEGCWQQAIADATAFISQWGAEAQAFPWTADELFGLHPVPEQPAANYSRLSLLDSMGLIGVAQLSC